MDAGCPPWAGGFPILEPGLPSAVNFEAGRALAEVMASVTASVMASDNGLVVGAPPRR
jgi:hypothetical protein